MKGKDNTVLHEELNIHILRIVASIMVVFIHTCAVSINQAETWNALNLYDSISRCSVPVFFMISGYLMLGKGYETMPFYRKRFIRILPPFVFFSALFFVLSGNGYNIFTFLSRFLNDKIYSHFWFMYILAGIYILFPFINGMWKNITKKDKNILVAIFFIISVLSITKYNLASLLGLHVSCIWFFILGGWLRDIKLNRALCLSAYLISSVCIFILTYRIYIESGQFSQKYYSYTHPLVVIQAISIFSFINSINTGTGLRPAWRGILKELSVLSLGVYLIHPVFIIGLDKFGYTNSYINPLIAIPAKALLCYGASLFSIYIMSRIRVLRYFSGV